MSSCRRRRRSRRVISTLPSRTCRSATSPTTPRQSSRLSSRRRTTSLLALRSLPWDSKASRRWCTTSSSTRSCPVRSAPPEVRSKADVEELLGQVDGDTERSGARCHAADRPVWGWVRRPEGSAWRSSEPTRTESILARSSRVGCLTDHRQANRSLVGPFLEELARLERAVEWAVTASCA